MPRHHVALAVLVLAGCSEAARESACGEHTVPITLAIETNAGNVFIPAPAVQATWSPCGASAVANDRGEATTSLGSGRSFAPRLSGDGMLTTWWPELAIDAPERITVRILRESMRVDYRLTNDAPLLWVTLHASGACESVDKATIEVVDHPEAAPEYIDADGAIDTSLRSTSSMGVALVRGLPAGARVRAIAKRVGCAASSGRFGAVTLEAGALSAMPIELR